MDVAEGMKRITENIIASNDMRLKAASNLAADIRNMLKEFSSDRKKMSDEQKEALSIFMKSLSGEIKDLLNEMQKNRKNMGETQAKSLAAFVKNLDKEVNTMINSFLKERGEKFDELRRKHTQEINNIRNNVKQIINEAKNLISKYKDDIGEAHNIWQEMSVNLDKSRKEGLITGIGAGETNLNVEEHIEKKKRKKQKDIQGISKEAEKETS